MDIGPALADARSEAGMSVEDVSERTRIRRTIISDIERDDYASCGGDFYARGHIRAIAKVVGTDPVPLIKEYDAGVAARDNPLMQAGPEPGSRLEAEGAARSDQALSWQPPAPEAGSQTRLNRTPVPGPDTAPQPPTTAGEPALPAPGSTAAATLGGTAGAAWQAGTEAVRRAAARLGQPAARSSGQPALRQFHGAVADLRRASAEMLQRMARLRSAGQRPSRIIGGLAIMLAALLLVLYGIFAGPAHSSPGPASRPGHPVGNSHPSPAGHKQRHGTRAPQPAAIAVRPLGVAAFGPGGTADGDNPQRARLALGGQGGGWKTSWYTTARFGGLKSGTGLLLYVGRVMVTRVAIRLGQAAGAVVQLRAGNSPVPGGLQPVTRAVSGSGDVVLTPRTPVRGGYLLIWLTRLPPDGAGTYQAIIDGIRLTGYRTPA